MTDSMGPGKLVRHMQNTSYTYGEYFICFRLGPSISSVICKNLSYIGPSYPSSPVIPMTLFNDIMPYFDEFIRLWLKFEYIVIPLENLDAQIFYNCQF